MATYGLDYYGTRTYGALLQRAAFDASPFVVRSTDYGVIDVSWARAGGHWSQQRLVRSTVGPALVETDGTVVLENAGGTYGFRDTGLAAGNWYYYTLLLFDIDTQSWAIAGEGQALVTRDYGYTDKLHDLIPSVFKSADLQAIGNSDTGKDTSLYRFLSIFGFEFDAIRSDYDSLLGLGAPRTVAATLLPAYAAQFGLTYEPELGASTMRSFIRSSVHLYKIKGTVTGVRDIASILTGWPAAVRIGKNLALNNPTAEQNDDVGEWGRLAVGCQVTYRPNDDDVSGSIGSGVVQVRVASSTGTVRVGTYSDVVDLLDRRLYGIPVRNGRTYTSSMSFSSARAGVDITMRTTYVDRDGNVLSTAVGVPVTPNPDDFNVLATVTAVAPHGSAFALVDWEATGTGGFAVNDVIYANGFQFEDAGAPTAWECARKVLISLTADLVNHVTNPSASVSTAGWTAGVTRFQDPDTLATSFQFTPPAAGPTAEAACTAGRARVHPGQTWTVLVEARDLLVRAPAAEAAASLRMYSRGVFVSEVIGEWQSVVANTWDVLMSSHTVAFEDGVDEVEAGVIFRLSSGNLLGTETFTFRRVALVKAQPENAFYFDGSVPSATGDFLWEGAPGLSRSHYYSRRTTKAARLRAVLPKYLPYDTCFDFLFAEPSTVIYGMPIGIENFDHNPGPPPPPPAVGRSLTLLWDTEV